MTTRMSDLGDRLLGTPRLVLAVVLLAAGAVAAVTAAGPVATGPAVVLLRDVAAGSTLGPGDVALETRPAAGLPTGAVTSLERAEGRRAVGPARAGEVVTDVRLAPEGFATGLGAGRAVTAVDVSARQVAAVGVGDLVRVVTAAATGGGDASGTPADEPLVLADRARVLAVWRGAGGGTDPGAGGGDTGATVVLDVDVGSASRLATFSGESFVGLLVLTA